MNSPHPLRPPPKPLPPKTIACICRICTAGDRELVSFAQFDARLRTYRLADVISAVGGVRVAKDDGLPQYCCVCCLREVEAAYRLRRTCQQSDRKLRESFRRVQQESEAASRLRDVVEVEKKKGESLETEELIFKEEIEEARLQEVDEVEIVDDQNTSEDETGPVEVKQEVQIEKENEEELTEVEESHLQEPIALPTIKREVDEPINDAAENSDENEAIATEANDLVEVDDEEQESGDDEEKEQYVEVMAIVESSGEEDDPKDHVGGYKCSSCKKTFATTNELQDHVDIAGDYDSAKELETRVQCRVYIASVRSSMRLNNRLRKTSDDSSIALQLQEDKTDEAIICCGCTQYCDSAGALIAHSQEVHYPHRSGLDEERPYQCNVCYQNFASGHERFAHKRRFLRKGVWYPCKKCGKGFFTYKGLQRHNKCHGPDLNDCNMCSFASGCSRTLRDHIARHNAPGGTFKCLVCERCYRSPAVLKMHSTLYPHPSKLPFRCPHCPRVFNVNSWLTKHVRKHIREGTVVQQVDDQKDTNE